MKKTILPLIMLLCILPMAASQALKFSPDGEFKIVQFTDLHYQWENNESDSAVICISNVLDYEKPDMVAITGDLIYSNNIAKCLPILLKPIIDRNIPFAVAFGNHDPEFDLTLPEYYDILQAMPSNLQPSRGEAYSPDYVLEVLNHEGTSPAETLYFFDTHSLNADRSYGIYEWVKPSQIEWYCNLSRNYTANNGGTPLPSLAFFHIPLPEYAYATAESGHTMIGTRAEAECAPSINTGLFGAMVEMGDILATFCGHDHDDDYIVDYYNILLGYGRYSGGNTVYNHIKPNGARVIVLKEGERSLNTWLRLSDGSVMYQTNFPTDFQNK